MTGTALRPHPTDRSNIMEQTLTLLHYQDACPSLNICLADQVRDMQLNDIPSLYADFRSPSRTRQRTQRKRRAPTRRRTRCLGYCTLCSPRDLSNRRRRLERHVDECNDESYRDERIVELNHAEDLWHMDIVQRYYNHGQNAEVIESIRPVHIASEGEEESTDINDRIEASLASHVTSKAEWIATPLWSLVIYRTLAPYSSSLTAKVHKTCTFAWHRNFSGIWELGYASQTLAAETLDPYGCLQTPIPVSCLCCSPNFGLYACSCAAFSEDWKSPEDPQRASLADWMGEQVWDAMIEADVTSGADAVDAVNRGLGPGRAKTGNKADQTAVKRGMVGEKTRIREWTFLPSKSAWHADEAEWDLVSEVSSTGSWRIIDVA